MRRIWTSDRTRHTICRFRTVIHTISFHKLMIHWSADRFRNTEKESDLFLRTYVHRTCIPDKRRCRAQTKCNWVRNSIIVFQRWLMKCRLLLVNLSTKGLMVQSIASHRMPLIPFRDGNMDIFWIDESAIMHYIRGLHSEMNLMQP